MKKLISLLLCLFLCCTFAADGFADIFGSAPAEHSKVKFEDMQYVRPDLGALTAAEDEVTAALDGSAGIRTVQKRIDDFFEVYYGFYTMSALARIRYFQDMTDEYYMTEYGFCSGSSAVAEQLLEKLYVDCAHSRYAGRLEKSRFWDGFAEEYGGERSGKYTDLCVELIARERELINRYYALTASPVITLEGESVELNTYLASSDDSDYYDAIIEYFRQYNRRLGELFIELVKLRTQLASELGYSDVRDMYAADYGRSFSALQESEYVQALAEYMVPLYAELSYSGFDCADISFSSAELLSVISEAAVSMGGQIKEAFEYLDGFGLFDISPSANKYPTSFTSYLYDYEAPFLFMSPVGDFTDCMNLAHEFGHFTQMYSDFNADCSLDLAECFSQGMEMLALCRSDKASVLTRAKFSDMLTLFIQQGMYARFEELVYSYDPEMLTPELLNALFLRCASRFGVTLNYSEEYSSMLWMDVPHLFEYPYYVLSYCLSGDTAMRLYELESGRTGAGVEAYERLLARTGSELIDVLSEAGLASPLREESVSDMAAILREVLIDGADLAA